jgi:hypothetical protein
LLELPLLYYPELLDIRLNGKTVPYQSVLFHGQQMAAITPLSGTLNTIRFQFQGVFWANWLSLGCWGLLMLFIIYKLTTRPKYIAMQL